MSSQKESETTDSVEDEEETLVKESQKLMNEAEKELQSQLASLAQQEEKVDSTIIKRFTANEPFAVTAKGRSAVLGFEDAVVLAISSESADTLYNVKEKLEQQVPHVLKYITDHSSLENVLCTAFSRGHIVFVADKQ